MTRTLQRYFTLGPWIGAVIGLVGNAIMSQNSGGGGGGGGPGGSGAQTYVPTGQPQADTNWQQIMQQWMDTSNKGAGVLSPQLMAALQQAFGQIPGVQQMMTGDASKIEGMGDTMAGAGRGLLTAGQQVATDAMDPMNAQRDRYAHDITQGTRAADSARGVGMSDYSSGHETDALTKFYQDWQTNQIAREAQGVGADVGASNAAGQQFAGAAAAYPGAASMYQGSWGLPFSLAGAYGSAMGSSVYNPWNALIGNLGQYMGLGQSGSQAAFNQGQIGLNNWTTLGNQIAQAFKNNNTNVYSGGTPGSDPNTQGYNAQPYGGGDTGP